MAITLFEAFSYLSVGVALVGFLSRSLGESLLDQVERLSGSALPTTQQHHSSSGDTLS
jgi:hypothetical protein